MLAGSDLLDLARLCLRADGLGFWNRAWRFGIAPEHLRDDIESALSHGKSEGVHWAASPCAMPGWLVAWFDPRAERPAEWREILSGFAHQRDEDIERARTERHRLAIGQEQTLGGIEDEASEAARGRQRSGGGGHGRQGESTNEDADEADRV